MNENAGSNDPYFVKQSRWMSPTLVGPMKLANGRRSTARQTASAPA